MPVRILTGAENIHELRSSGCYYVDKTERIYDLVQANTSKVTLSTRLRRLGKTLTMSMVEVFDIRCDSNNEQGLGRHDCFENHILLKEVFED